MSSLSTAVGGPGAYGGRRARAVFLLALAAVVLVLVRPGAAAAHAVFLSADPAPGARLPGPPATLRIVFSEPLVGRLSGVALESSSGRALPPVSAGVDPGDARAYVLQLPPLAPDLYTVVWHTVSLVDGHTRQGSYTFAVLQADGTAPVAAGSVAPGRRLQTPAAFDAAARWLALGGVFELVAALLPAVLASLPSRRNLLLAGLFAVLAGTAGQVVAAWLPAGGVGAARDVLATRLGAWWLLRCVAAGAIALAGLLQRRISGGAFSSATRAGFTPVVIAAFGLLLLTFAATSHGAASARPFWGAALDFIHLLAAALWIGGVAALGLLLRGGSTGGVRRYLQRYSVLAGICVPAVLLSGVASGYVEVGNLDDLANSAYGRALLVKGAVVALLLLPAAANALLLRRRFIAGAAGVAGVAKAAGAGHGADRAAWSGGSLLRWSAAAEAILGLAVLAGAATLAVQTPARSLETARSLATQLAADPNPAASFDGQSRIGTLSLDLTLTPATPGPNAARVELGADVRMQAVVLTAVEPDGRSVRATLLPGPSEPQTAGPPFATFQGALQVSAGAGRLSATVELPDGRTSAPILIPLSAPAKTAAGLPPVQGWLLAAALAIAGTTALAALRGLHRFARAAAAVVGAATLAGALASAAAAMTAAGGVSTSGWGRATREPVLRTAGLSSWKLPTPNAGLMTPAVGPDGAVWVAEMDTNRLARLQPGDGTVQELSFGAQGYQGSMGVAVDAQNHVWLAQETSGLVGRFDPATGDYEAFAPPTPNSAPSGITLDRRGTVWFTELNAGRIGSFDPVTRSFREFPLPDPGSALYWLAAAPDGRIWFTELGGRRAGVLDPTDGSVREFATPNDEAPTGVAVDGAGTVWVATSAGSLLRIDPATGAMTRFASPAPQLYGVAAGDGRIWAGSATADTFVAFNPATSTFTSYPAPAGSGPWWPAVGGDGSVWVALASPSANALARLEP